MNFKSKEHNLIYVDCNDVVDYVYKNLVGLELEIDTLPKKDLRKLTIHYFLTYIFKKSKNKDFTEKPVYFLIFQTFKNIQSKSFMDSVVYAFKKLKSLLPVPLVVIDNYGILKNKNGEYKGLSEKMMNFYINRKIETKKLKKYLKTEEYYELIKVFKDIVNIKTILI